MDTPAVQLSFYGILHTSWLFQVSYSCDSPCTDRGMQQPVWAYFCSVCRTSYHGSFCNREDYPFQFQRLRGSDDGSHRIASAISCGNHSPPCCHSISLQTPL